MNNLLHCWANYLHKSLLHFYCWIIYYLTNKPCCTYCQIKWLLTVTCSLQSRYLQFMSKAPFKLSTLWNRSSFHTSWLYTVSTLGNTAIPSLICLTLRNLTNHIAHDLTVWNTKENIKIQFGGLPTRSAPGRQQGKLCSVLSVSPSKRNSGYCWSWDLPASHSFFASQPFVTLHSSWMKKYFFSSA